MTALTITRGFYRAVRSRGAAVIVRPRRTGKPWKNRADFAQARNATVEVARLLEWRSGKKRSGNQRRHLVESTMGRLKLQEERLAARQPARQVAEAHVRCAILNTFNRLGMPVTVALT